MSFPYLAIAFLSLAAGPDPAPGGTGSQQGPTSAHWRIGEADLAPVFADGALAKALGAFHAGRYREAISLLDSAKDERVQVAYLRALALSKVPDRSAGPAFAKLAEQYPVLAARCHFYAASAFEEAGDADSALLEYTAVPRGAILWREAALGRARLMQKQGQGDLALQVLSEITDLPPGAGGRDTAAEALFDSAVIRLDRKDRVQSVATLVRLWSEHPLSPLSDDAGVRLKALGVLIAPELKIARAEVLLEAHRNTRAMEALAPLVADRSLAPELSCRARFLLGKAQRKERLYQRAIATLGSVVRECQDPGVRVRALYTLASAASIVAEEDAVTDYRELVEEFPDHPFADDALFFEADLLARLGRISEARRALLTLTKLYPDGDYRAEALFKAFWLQRAIGKPEAGLKYLTLLERDYAKGPETFDAERARYWRARTLAQGGKTADAVTAYESLAQEHPTTYYGMLARSRLTELAPDRSVAVIPKLVSEDPLLPLDAGILADDPHLAAAVELLRLGLNDSAAEDLLAIDRTRALGAGDMEAIRLVAMLLNRAGDARAAQAISRVELRADLVGPVTAKNVGLWKVAYPVAHPDDVEKNCKARSIDPHLFSALMREESALDPRALSWAGAVGMSQLLPSTAAIAARKLGIKGAMTRERLYDPVLNIQLGVETLSGFLKRFGNNAALALAAYNAGGGAVGAWLRTRGDLNLDEFVEEIPIAETRGYVRRVLRTYNTYRLLYAGQATSVAQSLMQKEKKKG
jgi:soluble lytic murein transglycosylase